jgi:hypothetical protein
VEVKEFEKFTILAGRNFKIKDYTDAKRNSFILGHSPLKRELIGSSISWYRYTHK